jgi:hypothetical protein
MESQIILIFGSKKQKRIKRIAKNRLKSPMPEDGEIYHGSAERLTTWKVISSGTISLPAEASTQW